MVGVLVGDQHGPGAFEGLGVGEDPRVDDDRAAVVLDAHTGVAELRDPHAVHPKHVAGGGAYRDGVTTIRPAVPDDAEALTHLHLDCWDDAYTGLVPQHILDSRRDDVEGRIAQWRTWLDAGASIQLAVEDDGLLGFVGAGVPHDPEPGLPPLELRVLYVRKARWGTPTGHALLRTEIGDRPAYLRVLASNERAIRFYARNGFVDDGTRIDDPDGALLRMVRP